MISVGKTASATTVTESNTTRAGVSERKIEFAVSAGAGVIVDETQFMAKANERIKR